MPTSQRRPQSPEIKPLPPTPPSPPTPSQLPLPEKMALNLTELQTRIDQLLEVQLNQKHLMDRNDALAEALGAEARAFHHAASTLWRVCMVLVVTVASVAVYFGCYRTPLVRSFPLEVASFVNWECDRPDWRM